MSILKLLKNYLFASNKNIKTTKEEYNKKEDIFTVYDALVPLKDLVLIDIQCSFQELVSKMNYNFEDEDGSLEEGQKDFALVYDDCIENIIGIVYSRDLVFRLALGSKKDGCDFLFSPIECVPITMEVKQSLDLMKEKNIPLLLVVNGRGEGLGITSKNNILDFVYNKTLVEEYFKNNKKNNSIVVEGTLLLKYIPNSWYIKEFNKCYKSGTRTIGGFLGYYTGLIPEINEEISLENLVFKVLDRSDLFVKTVLITNKELSNEPL